MTTFDCLVGGWSRGRRWTGCTIRLEAADKAEAAAKAETLALVNELAGIAEHNRAAANNPGAPIYSNDIAHEWRTERVRRAPQRRD